MLSFNERAHWFKEQNSHLKSDHILGTSHTRTETHTHKHVNLSNHTFSPTLQTPVFCGFFPSDDGLGLCQLSLPSPSKWLDYGVIVLFVESLEDGFIVSFDDDGSAVTALWFKSVKTHRIQHLHFSMEVSGHSNFPGTEILWGVRCLTGGRFLDGKGGSVSGQTRLIYVHLLQAKKQVCRPLIPNVTYQQQHTKSNALDTYRK